MRAALDAGEVAVVAGFQGITPGEYITTLGRGGSDLTAVALAAAIEADCCDIYTDVDGVYTTDPRIVAKARRLERISYEEMLEMASLGAKVLQTRSVELASPKRVPVRVLSSFVEPGAFNPGTLVCPEDEIVEMQVVSGVAYSRDEAKITEWWTMWPDANIGLATGEVSGRLVLDIDIKKGKRGVFPDIGHLEEVRIEACSATGIPIGGFMHPRGAGCHHNPVEAVIFNVVLDQVLTRIRAHVLIVSGNGDMGKGPGIVCDLLHINRSCNIDSTMTDIDADFHNSHQIGIVE